jgi:hypothetical protein
MASTGIIFAFIYMCTHYLHHIHAPTPFTTTSQDLFFPSVLQFCRRKKGKKKKWHFWSLKIKIGSFLVTLPCIYVLYHNWFISIFHCSTLVSFLYGFNQIKNSIFILM